jgi:acyl dehydratase
VSPWVEPSAFDKVGREIRRYVCDPVSMRSIREYCAGTDDWHPLYWDEGSQEAHAQGGVVAPPLFFLAVARRVVARDQLLEDGQHRDLGVEGVHGRSVQATQEVEIRAPVRPGDVLTVRDVLEAIEEKTGRRGKLVIVTVSSEYTNQDAVVAAVVTAQWIFR